ncbi:hypothetical protein BB561_005201 [Smittium simulii]|uniref:TRUD domain-containing protein n=1 Tax=Smittium simulii TaxID=133385 RepID=A0A2T9YBF6_9FUNG|nr:hypothetical protein BB561_005201 [Smittium simulii]
MGFRGKKRFTNDFNTQRKRSKNYNSDISSVDRFQSNNNNETEIDNKRDHSGRFERNNSYRNSNRSRFSHQGQRNDAKDKRSFSAANVQFFKETDVGIDEYIGESWEGTQFIIKHRFSDFIVNEVDPTGKVLYADDLTIPKLLTTESIKNIKSDEDIFIECKEGLSAILGEIIASDIMEYIKKTLDSKLKLKSKDFGLDSSKETNEGTVDYNQTFVIETELNKEDRGKIYNIIKSGFSKTIFGSTENGKIVLRNNNPRFQSRRDDSVSNIGDYIHFNLIKMGQDTMSCLNRIASALNVSTKRLSFSGTKDKRGVTTQRCCIFKAKADRLMHINNLGSKFIISNFEYSKNSLKLGDLSGNRFEIILRKVDKDKKINLENELLSLSTIGFINYFGLQRFGSAPVGSHNVGLMLLKQDWDAAVDLIMSPVSGDSDYALEAKKIWKESRDAKSALSKIPKFLVAENAILYEFVKSGSTNNSLNALSKIPRNLRLMYVHAYQSFIWNKAASERIRKYGFKTVIIGDLVLKKGSTLVDYTDNAISNNGENPTDNDVVNDDLVNKENEFNPNEFISYSRCEVEHINTENINLYTINDVVLPTFGLDIQYPNNDIKDVYDDALKKDNIDLDVLKCHPKKEYRLLGNYRPLITKPLDLSYEWIDYINDDEDIGFNFYDYKENLLKKLPHQKKDNRNMKDEINENDAQHNSNDLGANETLNAVYENPRDQQELTQGTSLNSEDNVNNLNDISQIENTNQPENNSHPETASQLKSIIQSENTLGVESDKDNKSINEQTIPNQNDSSDNFISTKSNDNAQENSSVPPIENKLALKICFTLPQSAYATMLLRELSRQDTSSGFHSILSNVTEND